MSKWALAVALTVAIAGCTRVVDHPQATPEPAVGPITAGQVGDLLSPQARGGEGNLFVSVDPDRCSGVAREVSPPFVIAPRPVAYDGGHWESDEKGVVVEEMVAVYRSSFDPANALAQAGQTIASCGDTPLTVDTMRGRTYVFTVPPPPAPDSDSFVLWSLRASDWQCDNAFIAAHNAAIEITSCGVSGGFDIASAARDALKRIETLANTTM